MTVLAAFLCLVTQVHDGDTWTCADGRKVRLAGVDANELNGSCHITCAAMPAREARVWLDRLVYRQRLTCRQVDTSYRRVVARCTLADGRSLSCAAIASGAAVRWDRYWRAYGMGECR